MQTTTALELSATPADARALGTTRTALEAMDHPCALYLASLSPNSRPTQILALRHVARFWGCTPWELPWAGLTRANLLVIRAWARDRWAASTANRILSATRQTVRSAADLGLLSVSDAEGICKVPSIKSRRVLGGRALERDELELLSAAAAARPTPASVARDRLVFALLYGAGLRRAELAALDLSAVNRNRSAVLVQGKGDAQRLVPLPAGTRAALARWLELRGQEPGPLLHHVDKHGRIRPARYSSAGIYFCLRRLTRAAELPTLSPHDLRRTYCGDLIDAGADVRTVQTLLGHASLETTMRYDRRAERGRAEAAELLDVP